MNNKIPVYKPFLSNIERDYVNQCIKEGWISSRGRFVAEFETKFSEITQIPYVTSCSNGTTALHLALLASGIKPGDEVICPSLTYVASAASIIHAGGKPIFVDSQIEDWHLDIKCVESAITKKTKAVLCVHLYGGLADIKALRELCDKFNLLLIEDCAEAFGTTQAGKHVGMMSDVSTFSFFGNKTITTGEGGMVASKNVEIIELVRRLKNQGLSIEKEYFHDIIGYNYRMTNIAAAIGCAQLSKLNEILERKKQIFKWYYNFLKENLNINLQKIPEDVDSAHWMVVLRHKKAILMRELLKSKGIETRPIFTPMHKLPIFSNAGSFKNAELIASEGINLPSYPELKYSDVKYICNLINNFDKENG